jgi:alpha-beta hydrolase superfamily lysophospholipase
MPATWGAGALLHPSRRAIRNPRPSGAEEIVIHGEGVDLRGWYYKGSAPRRGTVVYLHGSADNRASGISVAERFVSRGFDALIYDSRAHGESGGTACTYGYYEKKDLSDAIDSIRHQPVIVLGVSLGAAVALQAAADDRRIAAVIAVATFCDLRTVATGRAPFFATRKEIQSAFRLAEQRGRFKVDDVSPVASAARIRVPVLLVHGQADRDTPPWHSERVFAALAGPRKLLLVPGAGHNDALRAGVWDQIDAWIDDLVPKLPGGP